MVVKIIFILISAAVLFLNHFPDYYAWQNTPQGKVFSGQASWFDPWDINVYVSAIKWGQTQGLLLQNSYTTQNNPSILYYPLYTLTGLLFPQSNAFLLFHLLATAFGFILLITIWQLSKIFLADKKNQLLAFVLISLGGGIGWLLYPNTKSADLFMTGFTFSSHFQRGHEALGMVFYLLALSFFFLSVKNNRVIYAFISAISLGFLVIFYPFYILSFALITGIFSSIFYFQTGAKKQFTPWFWINALGIIASIFYIFHLRTNLTFGSVLSQSLPTPSILEILSGLGILVPLVIYQIKSNHREEKLFLNTWLVVSILLAFLPFGFARFYLRLIFFPAVILSIDGIKRFGAVTVILLFIVPISQLFIFEKRISEAGGTNPWFYLTSAEKQTLGYLGHQDLNSGILADYTFANRIPAISGNKVYLGHLLQTPKAQEKAQNITLFYSQKVATEAAHQFLDSENIDYVIWGLPEQMAYPFLKPVFQSGEMTVYSND